MKNTRQDFEITASHENGYVNQCSGLLPDGRGCLVPLAEPRAVGMGGLVPLAVHTAPDGTAHHFFYEQQSVSGVHIVRIWDGEDKWTNAGAIAGEEFCALSISDNEVAVGNGVEFILFRRTAQGWRQNTSGSLDVAETVRGVKHQQVSAQSGQFTVKTTTDRTPLLTDSAKTEIGKKLGAMYAQMCNTAAGNGMWIQPMAVQVRVLNRDGRTLHLGVPRTVTPCGWQCTSPISQTVTVADGQLAVPDLRAEAWGYKLSVGFTAALPDDAATVEVTASPQTHPVDLSGTSATRLTVHSSSSTLTVAMPGATDNFGINTGALGERLAAGLASLSSGGTVIARLDAALFAQGGEVTVGAPFWNLQAENASKPVAANSGNRETTQTLVGRIANGAAWGARHCAVSGATVALADVSVALPSVPHPMQLALDTVPYSGEWQAVTEIFLADGTRTARCFDGFGAYPESIAPFAGFGFAAATSLRLTVELENGNVWRAEVPLIANPHAPGTTFYPCFSLKAAELAPTDAALPSENFPAAERHTGTVLVCDASNPLAPTAMRVCGAPVKALCAAPRSKDGWEVSRSRFYAFTPRGVNGIIVSANGKTLGATTICEAAVTSHLSVASTPLGVYAATNTALWHLNGSYGKIVEQGFNGQLLGWHTGSGQLWSTDANGNTCVRKPAANGQTASRTEFPLPYAPLAFMATPGGMIAASEHATLLLDNTCTPPQDCDVSLQAWQTAPRGCRPVLLYVALSSSNFRGIIEILCHGGAGDAGMKRICRLKIDGAVNRPFSVRLLSAPHHIMVLKISGSASPDFKLEKATLTYEPARY